MCEFHCRYRYRVSGHYGYKIRETKISPRYQKNLFALKSLVKHKSKNPADVENIQKSSYVTAVEWAPAKLFGWPNMDTYPHVSEHQN